MECVDEVLAKAPSTVGGELKASCERVRGLFAARKPGSKDSGNLSRDFKVALEDAGFVIEIMGGERYVSPHQSDRSNPAVVL